MPSWRMRSVTRSRPMMRFSLATRLPSVQCWCGMQISAPDSADCSIPGSRSSTPSPLGVHAQIMWTPVSDSTRRMASRSTGLNGPMTALMPSRAKTFMTATMRSRSMYSLIQRLFAAE